MCQFMRIGVWGRLRPTLVAGAVAIAVVTSQAASLEFSLVPKSIFPSSRGEVFSGAWGDYDNDGRPDLFLCGLSEGPGELLRNTADGFVWVAGGALFEDRLPRAAAGWGDVNNDGRLDLYVAGAFGRQDLLYLNSENGQFRRVVPSDVSEGHGITLAWSDFDRDGWLDLYTANGGGAATELGYVLRNAGDGTLTRVSTGDLAGYAQYSHGATFGDYDGDGDDDLIVTSVWSQPIALFRNDGGGKFVRTSSGDIGGSEGVDGETVSWGDFDNDGDLDLLLVNGNPGSALYRNEAGILRRHVGSNLGDIEGNAVGGAWADFDNDGILDVVIARRTRAPSLYRGLGDGQFEVIRAGELVERGAFANALAVADYDLDGDLDVWFSNWGPASTDTSLYRNDTKGGNHLRVRLRGIRSNRQGIGAKVRVRTRVDGRDVWQLRAVGGFVSEGSHELIAHFGLGLATEAEQVRVEWPSGIVQEFPKVAANQLLLVDEAVGGPLGIIPDGGTFEGSVVVTMYSTQPSAEIRYTNDGTDPSATSTLYRGALTLSSAVTLKARLYINGFPVSEIQSAVFTPLPPLRFLPRSGLFTNHLDVVLISSVAGAEIRYTTNGTPPTATSETYQKPLRLTAATTVQARAFLNGFPFTDVVTETYRRVYAFDDDGISPAWRSQHFGAEYSTDPRAAVAADPDGDGTNNRQEFAADTDPLDPLSGFRLGVRVVPEIRFASVKGQTYRVLRLKSVLDKDPQVVAELLATDVETVWIDLEAGTAVNPAFYFVQPVPRPN